MSEPRANLEGEGELLSSRPDLEGGGAFARPLPYGAPRAEGVIEHPLRRSLKGTAEMTLIAHPSAESGSVKMSGNRALEFHGRGTTLVIHNLPTHLSFEGRGSKIE